MLFSKFLESLNNGGEVLMGDWIGGGKDSHRDSVIGDVNSLPFGDVLEELRKMRFGLVYTDCSGHENLPVSVSELSLGLV